MRQLRTKPKTCEKILFIHLSSSDYIYLYLWSTLDTTQNKTSCLGKVYPAYSGPVDLQAAQNGAIVRLHITYKHWEINSLLSLLTCETSTRNNHEQSRSHPRWFLVVHVVVEGQGKLSLNPWSIFGSAQKKAHLLLLIVCYSDFL